MKNDKKYLTIAKYFSIFVTILAHMTSKKGFVLVTGLLETVLIFTLSNMLYDKENGIKRISVYIISSIFLFSFHPELANIGDAFWWFLYHDDDGNNFVIVT